MNIYLENDEYTLDRSQLIKRILSEIHRFLIQQLENTEIGDYNYSLLKSKTKIGNVFILDSVTIPVNDVVLINQQYNDLDTDAQVLINLKISIREGVVGENLV
jgi:aromatic ring hydroxylase